MVSCVQLQGNLSISYILFLVTWAHNVSFWSVTHNMVCCHISPEVKKVVLHMALVNGMKYSEIQKLTTVSERATASAAEAILKKNQTNKKHHQENCKCTPIVMSAPMSQPRHGHWHLLCLSRAVSQLKPQLDHGRRAAISAVHSRSKCDIFADNID